MRGSVRYMFEGFYLVHRETDDWWQLRLKDTHYVVSCATGKDRIISFIKSIIKKYKTELNLRRTLNRTMYDKGRVGEKEFERRKKEYEEVGDQYDHLLHQIIKEALEEVKNDTIVMRTKKIFKKVKMESLDAPKEISKNPQPLETPVVKVIKPRIGLGVKIKK